MKYSRNYKLLITELDDLFLWVISSSIDLYCLESCKTLSEPTFAIHHVEMEVCEERYTRNSPEILECLHCAKPILQAHLLLSAVKLTYYT
jgi:hypothetical protein